VELWNFILRRVDVCLLVVALMLSACWISSVVAHPERHKEQARVPAGDDGYISGLPHVHRFVIAK
jgi:hypothetical protein